MQDAYCSSSKAHNQIPPGKRKSGIRGLEKIFEKQYFKSLIFSISVRVSMCFTYSVVYSYMSLIKPFIRQFQKLYVTQKLKMNDPRVYREIEELAKGSNQVSNSPRKV